MNAASEEEKHPLIVILGPTASGKSALGIEIAKRFNGEVIVCDSTQVFRHFDIGTAKVPAPQQQGIPHHLVDLVEPEEIFTAGEYRRRALEVLDDIKRRHKLPVLTAGTGLYLRALLEGLADAPERSEELRDRLREIVARRSAKHLHKILARIDAEAAKRIAPKDTQKTIRAIEICLLGRKSVGDVHRSGREPLQGFAVTKIGLAPKRPSLNERINRRTHAMIDEGWVEEVRRLVARRIAPGAKPFQFIGYSELREFLEGRMSQSDAVIQIQQATRQFAKRQMTWFRREPDVHWMEGFGDEERVQKSSSEIVAAASSSST